MCVAFFTLEHPDYALILCANRDEVLDRPTHPAAFHAFGREDAPPHVLSGIDAQAGGTWLGLTRAGKLALLTNITEPHHHTYAASRGALVTAFLSSPSSSTLEADAQHLPPDARFAGFNLLLLAPTPAAHFAFDARLVTNHGGGQPIAHRALSDAQRRLGALSNGIDGSGADEWPKVQHGRQAFQRLLDALPPEDGLVERLFELLTWRSAQPLRDRSELRETILVDPVQIGGAPYATRLSTVVLVNRTGRVLFVERDRWTLDAHGHPTLADPGSQRVFRFDMESVISKVPT